MSFDQLPYYTYKASLNDIITDTMLNFTKDGKEVGDINLAKDCPDWKYIVVESQVDTITGTKFALTGKTGVDVSTALTSASAAALKGDGSTAMASGDKSATGYSVFSCVRSGSGGTASNIGSLLNFLCDVTTITALTGNVFVTVFR